VALYLYVLPLNPRVSLAVVIVLAILTFVPTRHLYPSQPGTLNQVTTILGSIWTPFLAWMIWSLPTGSQTRPSESTLWLAYGSLAYPLFYLGVSWAISVNHWRKKVQTAGEAHAGESVVAGGARGTFSMDFDKLVSLAE